MNQDELHKELRKWRAFLSLTLYLVLANWAASFTLPPSPQHPELQPDANGIWGIFDSSRPKTYPWLRERKDPNPPGFLPNVHNDWIPSQADKKAEADRAAFSFLAGETVSGWNSMGSKPIDVRTLEPIGFGGNLQKDELFSQKSTNWI